MLQHAPGLGTMFRQQLRSLVDCPRRGNLEWGSAFVVLRIHIRAVLEESAYDFRVESPKIPLDPCLHLNIRRQVQRGSAPVVPCTYIRTMMLEQRAYDLDFPVTCRVVVPATILPLSPLDGSMVSEWLSQLSMVLPARHTR